MTFQTKLRALKQQELNKYNKLAHDMAQQQHQQHQTHPDGKPAAISDHISNNNMQATELLQQQQQQQQEDEYHQGTGECGTGCAVGPTLGPAAPIALPCEACPWQMRKISGTLLSSMTNCLIF